MSNPLIEKIARRIAKDCLERATADEAQKDEFQDQFTALYMPHAQAALSAIQEEHIIIPKDDPAIEYMRDLALGALKAFDTVMKSAKGEDRERLKAVEAKYQSILSSLSTEGK